MRAVPALLVALLALGATGCADERQGVASPTPETPSPDTTSGSTTPPSDPTTPPESTAGGTAEDPVEVEPVTDLLDWRPSGPVETTVTVSGPWTLEVPESGAEARLTGPDPRTVSAPPRFRITDALIDGEYAVIVAGDTLEQKPGVATVIDLATGRTRTLDGSSPVPTTNGGSWALGEGRLLHATIGPKRSYCLASVDLASGDSERLWCAEPRHGFNAAAITPAGTSLMTFDDQRPSCRTVAAVDNDGLEPFEGVAECLGWEGVTTPDGAVWSVVPDQRRVEQARMYARIGKEYFDLGAGTSGTLTWCAGAAYFARDPQRDGEPASVLRWSDAGRLEVVYETAGRGPAFVADQARCGGDALTVTALGRAGDSQVTATLR